MHITRGHIEWRQFRLGTPGVADDDPLFEHH